MTLKIVFKLSKTEITILMNLSKSMHWEDIASPNNKYYLRQISTNECILICRKLNMFGLIELEERNDVINGINAKITTQGLSFLSIQLNTVKHVQSKSKSNVIKKLINPIMRQIVIGIIITVLGGLTLYFIINR